MAKKKRPPPSKPAPKLTTEQRIDRIAYLMLRGEWAKRRVTTVAKAWGVTHSHVCKLADRAAVRIEIATGKLEQLRIAAHLDLDAIQREARKAGQFSAAVRAVEARLKLGGAYAPHRSPRDQEAPRGLPPELATLDPPPTVDEVSHFAAVERTDDCGVEGCRVHGKAAPGPGAVH